MLKNTSLLNKNFYKYIIFISFMKVYPLQFFILYNALFDSSSTGYTTTPYATTLYYDILYYAISY